MSGSRTKNITCSLLLLALFSLSGKIISQDVGKLLDRVYGPDQTLCNGKKYDYVVIPGTKGHQYLSSPQYSDGSVILKGKVYQNVALNYDILNQELLLKFEDQKGNVNIIEVSKAWIKSFSLNNMNFEYLSLEQRPDFYQVLGEGPLRILYSWRKSLNLEATMVSTYYTFTPALKDSFVLRNGQRKPFRTNRSLVRIFDPEQRGEIRSWLRKNKVKVKKASDQAMTELINYISQLR